MNGNFRNQEFVKRHEYAYYNLQTPLNSNVGANNRQTKGNYLFVVDNSSEANPIDWYNSYIEVDIKQLNQDQVGVGITASVGNVNTFLTTTTCLTFIREIQIECNGITAYNNTRANESSNVLSLLKYTKEYAESVGKDNFFYIDKNTGAAEPQTGEALYNKEFAIRNIWTDAAAVNKISLPLNMYSYFAAFKNNLHPDIKMSILIRLKNDNNIVFSTNQAPGSKVLITKFRLWSPKIIFNGTGMKLYLENYLKPKKWIYLREHEQIIQTAAESSFFFFQNKHRNL